MKRNFGLDVLKIMACFSVVVLHVSGIIATNSSEYSINHTLYYTAGLAVPIFFMVNGNLLLNKNNISYNYILKKIINILFVVFSWNILMFLAKLIVKRKMINPFYTSFSNLIQKEYFWQFWFFGALIIIYLVLPILYKYFNDCKSAIIITGIFVVISLIIDLLSLIRSFEGHSIIQVHIIQTFRVWTWFAYYLLGGLLGKQQIKEYLLNNISNFINWIIFLIALISINVYQYNVSFLYKNFHAEFFYDNIITFIWIISLFMLTCRQNFTVKKNKFIDLLSSNIMGIYIVHVTVIKFFTHFYKFDTSITNIGFIFIVFITSLILTLIISKIPLVNRLIRI